MSNPTAAPTSPTPLGDHYPVNLDVEYPDRPLNRVTTFFRGILAIPVLVLLAMLAHSASSSTDDFQSLAAVGGFIFLPTLLLLLFRHRYPRWWFDFNVNLLAFTYRIVIYFYLLRDEYPSTEDRQALLLEIPYPDAKQDLSRGMPLVKWLLAFPHYLILSVLVLGVAIATLIAWFAILFTGRYPRGLFEFTVGVLRWSSRVSCYAVLLTTDKYPPFRLKA